MNFKYDEISVNIPDEPFPECTELYISFVLKLLTKGLRNPAFQLHVLSMMSCGKSFVELTTNKQADVQHAIETLKVIMKELSTDILSSKKASMTDTTIDDFLSGL